MTENVILSDPSLIVACQIQNGTLKYLSDQVDIKAFVFLKLIFFSTYETYDFLNSKNGDY